jgi:hypothetical protein
VPHAVVADPGMKEDNRQAVPDFNAGQHGSIEFDVEFFNHGAGFRLV